MTLGPASAVESTKEKLRNEEKEDPADLIAIPVPPNSSLTRSLPLLSASPPSPYLTRSHSSGISTLTGALRRQSNRPAGWEAAICRGGEACRLVCLFFCRTRGKSCVRRRVQWVWRESGCPAGTGGTSLTVRHTPYTYRCRAGGRKKQADKQGVSVMLNRNDERKSDSSIRIRTYPCPQGRSSVSAMTSQHSVQQLSRMLTCFNNARRRCLQKK